MKNLYHFSIIKRKEIDEIILMESPLSRTEFQKKKKRLIFVVVQVDFHLVWEISFLLKIIQNNEST